MHAAAVSDNRIRLVCLRLKTFETSFPEKGLVPVVEMNVRWCCHNTSRLLLQCLLQMATRGYIVEATESLGCYA